MSVDATNSSNTIDPTDPASAFKAAADAKLDADRKKTQAAMLKSFEDNFKDMIQKMQDQSKKDSDDLLKSVDPDKAT